MSDKILNVLTDDSSADCKQEKAGAIITHENIKTILASTLFGVVVIGRDRRIRWVNEYASALVGVENPDVLYGQRCEEYLCSACQKECPIFDKGQTIDNSERILRRHDGREIAILKTVTKIELDGEPVLLETFVDISDYKQTEQALRESETKYKTLYESSRDAIMILAPPDWKFIAGNRATVELFAAKNEEEFTSKGPWDVSPEYQPDGQLSYEKAKKMIEKAMKEGSNYFEWQHKRLNGQEFPAIVLITRIDLEGKQLLQVTVRDITERKKVEGDLREYRHHLEKLVNERTVQLKKINKQLKYELAGRETVEWQLQKSNDRYHRIVNSVTDYIYTVSIENGLPVETIHSDTSVAVTGYTPQEIADDPYLWIEMVHPDERQAVREQARLCISGEDTESLKHRIIHKDGVTCWVKSTLVYHSDDQGKVLSYDGLLTDITEQKYADEIRERLEAQLQQSRKIEAIGTLAGGIAHDFNNILGSIIGYTELALEDVPGGTIANDNLKQVLVASSRAKNLVRQILTFSCQNECQKKPVEIASVVMETLALLMPSLPATIEVKQNIDAVSSMIMADSTQIHQIMMNLCINASDAMMDRTGVLEVSLADIDLKSDTMYGHNKLQAGQYVKFSVKDTGEGMDVEIMERIFEPFFTTKDVDKGTGMGLAVVHGIVEDHGGIVIVDSEVRKGTTFSVYFPKIESNDISEDNSLEIVGGQGEVILVVDDEKFLVDITKQLLQRYGYTVVGKTNSVDALETFRAEPDKFDLVITDYAMPGMTGKELAEELLETRPDIPIVLCTGFSEEIDLEETNKMGIKKFVMKPVARKEITKIIRSLLDKREILV